MIQQDWLERVFVIEGGAEATGKRHATTKPTAASHPATAATSTAHPATRCHSGQVGSMAE